MVFFQDKRLKYGLLPLISILTYNKLINFTLIWLWGIIWLVFGRLSRLEIHNLLNKFINYTLWEFIVGYSIVLLKKDEDVYFLKYAGLFLCILLLKCFHYLLEQRLGEWNLYRERGQSIQAQMNSIEITSSNSDSSANTNTSANTSTNSNTNTTANTTANTNTITNANSNTSTTTNTTANTNTITNPSGNTSTTINLNTSTISNRSNISNTNINIFPVHQSGTDHVLDSSDVLNSVNISENSDFCHNHALADCSQPISENTSVGNSEVFLTPTEEPIVDCNLDPNLEITSETMGPPLNKTVEFGCDDVSNNFELPSNENLTRTPMKLTIDTNKSSIKPTSSFEINVSDILTRVGEKKDFIFSEIFVQSSKLNLRVVSHRITDYNSYKIASGISGRLGSYCMMSTGLARRLESYESIRTGISGRLRVFKSYRLALGLVLLNFIDLLLVARFFQGFTNKPNILLGIFGFEILQLYPLIIITSLKYFKINKKVMYVTEFIINLLRFIMICFFAAVFLYWYTLPLHILPSSYLSLKILVVKSRNLLNFKKNQIVLRKLTIPLDYDYNCIICFDDFDNCQSTRQLKCGHIYHFDCIKDWLDYSRQCPICRKNV